LEGLRLRQRGEEKEARQVWADLVKAFAEVKAEQNWVVLAKKELSQPSEPPPSDDKRWKPAREALGRARRLCDEGKREEAETIWNGLEKLYKNDASAAAILNEVKRDRGR
jgi:hypothetical protein